MRKERSKGRRGTLMQCPKCRYKWRVKDTQGRDLICCSRCKRYFKKSQGRPR